jgi:PIN domain nuclease of toxin-antitoxin system
MEDSGRLSRSARKLIADPENRILVSAAVGWELAIKVNLGKIKPRSLLDRLSSVLQRESFAELPISLKSAVEAGLLPPHHSDPFDRVLVAQALALDVPILSLDRVLDHYGVKRLW